MSGAMRLYVSTRPKPLLLRLLAACHADLTKTQRMLTVVTRARLGAGFGGVAGIFALFFFAEIPRVSQDILSKVPIIGEHFIHEVPPEDNPF